eukprot:gb/GEZN01016865.1/.p1 GENE.gb/GEZN01016865.1/~~gb/GEZN01016865.1/.p1  ORF type:complete len:232 (-),score=27.63 gb/GEZN01016865.1/:127-735(-)
MVLYASAFPRVSTLGRVPHTELFRNVKQYKDAEVDTDILILRIDAAVYFANTIPIRDAILAKMSVSKSTSSGPQTEEIVYNYNNLVLDFSPVVNVDSTGLHLFADLIKQVEKHGVKVYFANPNHSVVLAFKKAGILEQLGPFGLHTDTAAAVEYIKSAPEEIHGDPDASQRLVKYDATVLSDNNDKLNYDAEAAVTEGGPTV